MITIKKWVFIIIMVISNITITDTYTSTSQILIGLNPPTTCPGVCCNGGSKSLTIDTACPQNGFRGFFTSMSIETCSTSPTIIPFVGCTQINQTGIFNNTQQCTQTTYWGYNNTGNTDITVTIGNNNYIINQLNNQLIPQPQTQLFLSGVHYNDFSITTPCSYGFLSWTIIYDGFNSSIMSSSNSSCYGRCCNSTYCITSTDPSCSMITSGTIKWGIIIYYCLGGYGSNCTNGQPVSDTLPFPCECTSSTNNNYYCGLIRPIVLDYCIINNGSQCTVAFSYNNSNSETIIILQGQNNNINGVLNTTILTTTFLPGYYYKIENMTYNCYTNRINRTLITRQTYANY